MLFRVKKASGSSGEVLEAEAEVQSEQAPQDPRPYEELFRSFSQGAEKLLIRMAAALAILLVLVQLALMLPFVRSALVPVERLEGVPFDTYRQIENR